MAANSGLELKTLNLKETMPRRSCADNRAGEPEVDGTGALVCAVDDGLPMYTAGGLLEHTLTIMHSLSNTHSHAQGCIVGW